MSYQIQSKHEFGAGSNTVQSSAKSRDFFHNEGATRSHIANDELCSLKWGEQINNNRFDKEKCSHETDAKKSKGGLGTELIKLLKEASYEKKASSGKRKPLGNVSNGSRLLQSRAASKQELKKIHSKLTDMC
mmetsp:Transcript_24597/g.53002  ORF Transcript_24597/g.53002 Transcript_24597/m.53002 type:complete len:132 (+) Transcript_24597:194-589(+)